MLSTYFFPQHTCWLILITPCRSTQRNVAVQAALAGLSNYLREEHKTKKEAELDLSGWKQVIAKKIPQQMNGSDCGMFTCKFAEYLSRRAKFTFSQSNMPYFRKRMVYEICKNQIMHP